MTPPPELKKDGHDALAHVRTVIADLDKVGRGARARLIVEILVLIAAVIIGVLFTTL